MLHRYQYTPAAAKSQRKACFFRNFPNAARLRLKTFGHVVHSFLSKNAAARRRAAPRLLPRCPHEKRAPQQGRPFWRICGLPGSALRAGRGRSRVTAGRVRLAGNAGGVRLGQVFLQRQAAGLNLLGLVHTHIAVVPGLVVKARDALFAAGVEMCIRDRSSMGWRTQ